MKKAITIDWTDLSMEPKWYDFNSGEVVGLEEPQGEGQFLQIRPFPAQRASVVVKDDGILITGEQQKEIYDFCFLKMKGFVDANEKILELTVEVKLKIFEFKLEGIPDFVIMKSREFENKKAIAVKK